MSIGGVVARAEIMNCLDANSISTFGGTPITMAAGLANLTYLLEHDLQGNARRVGGLLIERLRAIAAQVPAVREVRGRGLMLGVELVEARHRRGRPGRGGRRAGGRPRGRACCIGKGGGHNTSVAAHRPAAVADRRRGGGGRRRSWSEHWPLRSGIGKVRARTIADPGTTHRNQRSVTSSRTVIRGGLVITASDEIARRRPDRGRPYRRPRRHRHPGRRGLDRRAHHRRHRQVRHPGRRRRAHPHGAAVRRHLRLRHLRDRHPGRRLGRHHHHRRLRRAERGPLAARGPGRLARQGRRQLRHRLRLPHDRLRRQRGDAQGDGPAGGGGRHLLQAVHGLPRRLLQRRRADPARHAALRRERRPDHDARRERHRHRRPGRTGAGRAARPTRATTARSARRCWRPRPPTAPSSSPRWPARPLYVVHVSARGGRRRAGHGRATRGSTSSARPARSTCSCPPTTSPSRTSRAPSTCAPRPLRPREHQAALWRGLRTNDLQVVSTDHCPFCFVGQKELGRGDFSKIPNGLPGVENRMDLLHQAVVDGHISRRRWIEIACATPARMFGLYPKKGTIAPGRRRRRRHLRPARRADRSPPRRTT